MMLSISYKILISINTSKYIFIEVRHLRDSYFIDDLTCFSMFSSAAWMAYFILFFSYSFRLGTYFCMSKLLSSLSKLFSIHF